jgi:hypothetical protein
MMKKGLALGLFLKIPLYNIVQRATRLSQLLYEEKALASFEVHQIVEFSRKL